MQEKKFSFRINGLGGGLTVLYKSLILGENFFSNEINGLAGVLQAVDEVLVKSMTYAWKFMWWLKFAG